MSSLWTPGGEVPMDRNRPSEPAPEPEPSAPPPTAGAPGEDEEAEIARQVAALQAQMLQAPASAVVTQHAAGLYELAALHLAQDEPRLDEARLATDAFAAIVEGLEGRLGEAEPALRQALHQLRLHVVERSKKGN